MIGSSVRTWGRPARRHIRCLRIQLRDIRRSKARSVSEYRGSRKTASPEITTLEKTRKIFNLFEKYRCRIFTVMYSVKRRPPIGPRRAPLRSDPGGDYAPCDRAVSSAAMTCRNIGSVTLRNAPTISAAFSATSTRIR